MTPQKKFYIFLSVLFILTFALVLGSELFAFTYLSSVQGNYKEADYRNSKLTEKLLFLNQLSERHEEIEEDVSRINTALPDKKDSSKLLSDLDSLASQSGLKLTLLQSTNYGKKQQVAADRSLLQTIKGKYGEEMPLDVKVEGSYSNFLSFIKRLENYQRMVNVTAIEITKVDEIGAAPDLIEVKLKLTAYLKK